MHVLSSGDVASILRIRFSTPRHGWMPIDIESHQQHLTFAASHTPYASLFDLITSLMIVATTATTQTIVRWTTEPIEYDFVFTIDQPAIQFDILEYPTHARLVNQAQHVFSFHSQPRPLVTTFWRALRNLESRWPHPSEWNEPFPSRELARLGATIASRVQ
jgi:hypothetical protein